MKQFSDIPIDVARLVFEIAATSDQQTACALSYVSQQVQSWSDPFLFRHIVIIALVSLDEAMLRFIDSFISKDPSPRIRRARGYVKTISSKQYDDGYSRIPNFVRRYSSLESLRLRSLTSTHLLFKLIVPSLRKLSFPYHDTDIMTRNMPLFYAITHLEVDAYETFTIWDADFDISAMPSLTHLTVVMNKNRINDMNTVITTVSAYIPPRFKLLLLLLRRGQKNSLEGVTYDERIILGVLPRLGDVANDMDAELDDVFEDEWGDGTAQSVKEGTRWDRAERMLRDKRRKALSLDH
ncbi:hypothetical protein DL96DRAFT_1631424 [Flagelloscypha sp. PMI_526]|nr:hypothetical protein DL96DRAFT_1631424 [Flagelloscypha sp. PMI_526]